MNAHTMFLWRTEENYLLISVYTVFAPIMAPGTIKSEKGALIRNGQIPHELSKTLAFCPEIQWCLNAIQTFTEVLWIENYL